MAQTSKRKAARILVVDDDRLLLDMIKEVLLAEGYRVHTAPDGARALRKLRRTSFDMVVTDLNMPVMNGRELVNKIFVEHKGVTPVLMSTDVETTAARKGDCVNLNKPFQISSLLSIIENSLQERRTDIGRF